MARFRLDRTQVDALKAGDAASLAAAGVDVAAVHRIPLQLRLRARLLAVFAVVLGLLGTTGVGTASAARALDARKISGRVLRLQGRISVDGRIAARLIGTDVVRYVRLAVVPDGCYLKDCAVFEIVE